MFYYRFMRHLPFYYAPITKTGAFSWDDMSVGWWFAGWFPVGGFFEKTAVFGKKEVGRRKNMNMRQFLRIIQLGTILYCLYLVLYSCYVVYLTVDIMK